MTRFSFLLMGVFLVVAASLAAEALALEKVKIATPYKELAHYDLPMTAAQEKGFWKDQGLEVEWSAFSSGGALGRAFAAGAVNIGLTAIASTVVSAARGLPIILIADPKVKESWFVLVVKDSPIKGRKHLKGKVIGITRSGSLTHAYGLVAARAWGMEGSIKFVATGGGLQQIAAVIARKVDAMTGTPTMVINLLAKGKLRIVEDISSFLPQGRTLSGLVARKDWLKDNAGAATKVIKAFMRTNEFIRSNPEWSIKKLQVCCRYTPDGARELYKVLKPSSDMRIDRRSVEEVRAFVIMRGLVKKEEAPPVEALFTNAYIP